MNAKELNPTDLRLNNLVWFRDKKIVKVSNLGNSFETVDLVNELRYGSDDINEYHGVELTEEWLIKFGFENCNMGFSADYKKGEVEINLVNGFYEYCDLCRIKYVHQLQNLIHSLTGLELTIKE